MNDSAPKTKRFSPAHARAAVKAQRWAMKYRPKPPPKPRRPVAAVVAVTLGGLVAGGLLGALLERGGMAPGALTESWVVPLDAPDAPTVTAQLDDQDAMAPAAGPKGAQQPAAFVYEEPLSPGEPAPGPSDGEIDAMVRHAGINRLAVPDDMQQDLALWEKNALRTNSPDGRPMIALVIDDLGVNQRTTPRAIALPGPLTLSFMTYSEGLESLARRARAAGHELMLHVPMEPRDPGLDSGPNTLRSSLPRSELTRRLNWALDRFDGYVGVNNHMGSRFTGSLLGMAQVMAELKSRGLLFLDSVTSGSSVGVGLARRMGVAHAARDIFIDNDPEDPESIRRQLAKLEAVARRRGRAVGIGHPHGTTIEVLARWLPELERRGFALVPISAVVRQNMKVTPSQSASAQ